MTRPTWKQAITIMKQLQLEYGLPIFAATFQGCCSCCADVSDLNRDAYLDDSIKDKSWSNIGAYVIFSNSHNGSGEARLSGDFGDVKNDIFGPSHRKKQYVRYRTNRSFTTPRMNACMQKFVDEMNKLSDTKYAYEKPESKSHCGVIVELD